MQGVQLLLCRMVTYLLVWHPFLIDITCGNPKDHVFKQATNVSPQAHSTAMPMRRCDLTVSIRPSCIVGGLMHSALIKHNLLGTFVPFLPLERKHVEQCVRDLGYNRRVSEETVRRVADSIEYYPYDSKLFAKTGCTSVPEKFYQHDEFQMLTHRNLSLSSSPFRDV